LPAKIGFCQNIFYYVVILLSAPASSAAIERIFSNFGYSHSKLRNRFGTTTAAKLIFCYRMLRGNVTTDVPDDWDIDNDGAAVSQLDVNDEATVLPQDSSASEAESE